MNTDRSSKHHRRHASRHGAANRRRNVLISVSAVAVLVAVTVVVGLALGSSGSGTNPTAHGASSGTASGTSPADTTPGGPPASGDGTAGAQAAAVTTAPARNTTGTTAPDSPPADMTPAPPAPLTTPVPVRVRIPAIGVDSSLQSLGLTGHGELQQPSQWQRAGWYADGVRPGDPGPAVIAGHVDSTAGPAVFFRLKELQAGDRVMITDKAGTVRTFVVDTLVDYQKRSFPSQAVYGPTPTPVLRLITCTGDFDRAAHSYVDNLVVTAHLST